MPDTASSEHTFDSPLTLSDAQTTLLDNPIWNALGTRHLPLAQGDERARRYPATIGPLSGIPAQTPENYEALRQLAGPDGIVVLFLTEEPRIPAGWTLVRGGQRCQMVHRVRGQLAESPLAEGANLRQLTANDAPAMVALAELTEPGPFRLRTLELGNFYGVFHNDQLMAMAGKRMHLPGFIEISAVCTHPDARGRGYARQLMSRVIEEIEQARQTPFLHALPENPAVKLYESLVFAVRQTFHLAVLKNEA